jgi:hypothetical protein
MIAFDNLGNASRESASINILLGILPPGPASTPQPYVRPESTPLPATTAVPSLPSEVPQGAVVNVFGSTPEPAAQATAVPENIETPRETPAQTSVLDWLQSVFLPDANTTVDEISVGTSDEPHNASDPSASNTDVLWGASAAAMIGAATAYALDEKRKREEEAESKREEIEARIEEQQAQKIAAAEARKVAQWLEGQALLKKQELQALELGDVTEEERLAAYKESEQYQSYQARMTDWQAQQAKLKAAETADMTEAERLAAYKDSDEYKERQAALEEYHHEQRVRDADTARWEGLARQGENPANMPEENWWEKTKSFVQEQVIEPFSTYVYVPYLKPAVEQTKEAITSGISWVNETIYTPYILPKVEEVKQKLSDDIAWINEHFYQPYVAPKVEKAKQEISNGITWVNEHVYQPTIKPFLETKVEQLATEIEWFNVNVYQPHLQPLVAALNAGFIQPYVQPFLDEVKDVLADYSTWVNTNIYVPLFKPVVDDAKDLWAEYGEWVHNALDAVGFIPGLGDIADGLNGLIYLGEGHYLEASISLVAMIPILGDLGKAGKLTAKLGQELLEETAEKAVKETVEEFVEAATKETVEEVVEQAAKETGEELIEITAKETVEETVEKAAKEAVEELTEKAAKESANEVAQKALKEAGEELVQGATREVAEKTTKEVTNKVVADVTGDAIAAAPATSIKNAAQTFAEEAVEETLEQVSEETAQLIATLTEKYGKETVGKFIPFCEKYGINPYDVLSRPPAEGQSLIGWGLGIDNLGNPVNHPLLQLNLTEAEVQNILEKSIKNPNSKVVVLGYGGGVAKPYYKLGDEIEGCYLSLSDEAWAPFDQARANFWAQINAPFLEKAIENRKIFLFNVEYDVITNPRNVERFSLPELRLIEQAKNNYVQVPVGEYTAFVPAELIDTFDPIDLLAKGV